MKKISFCTVCMNRLVNLRQTLPANIRDNMDYPNIEFVVLDYNSGDNMGDWIKENLSEHIESGILKYYKNSEPEFFHYAHSKNMAMRLATGEIICMIDSDNFAGPGYAHWVNAILEEQGPQTVITTLRKDSIPHKDQGGKFCITREFLYEMNGMDEGLIGYGMDDVELVNRLEVAGGRRFFIQEEKFLRFLSHSDVERLRNVRYVNKLQAAYIREPQTEPDKIHILYLFKDNSFSDVRFEHHAELDVVRSFGGWILSGNGHRPGTFTRADGLLTLTFDDEAVLSYRIEGEMISSMDGGETSTWKEVKREDDRYLMVVLGYCECLNRHRMLENEKNWQAINPNGWGKGIVTRNFEDDTLIAIS